MLKGVKTFARPVSIKFEAVLGTRPKAALLFWEINSCKNQLHLMSAHHPMCMEDTLANVRPNRKAYADQSTKRATNLSLSKDVLDATKALGINISAVCDAHLREVVMLEQQRRWRTDYTDFIRAYKNTVEAEGLPLD